MKKNNSSLLIGILVVVIITAAVTWQAGTLSGRFGGFRGIDEARASMKALPMEIGKWKAEEDRTISDGAVKMLQIQNSYILRTYRHADTQEAVHMTLMVGPSGIITVHTPEVCFGGRDYTKEAARTRVPISVPSLSGDEDIDSAFWRVDFVGRSLDINNRISFYWGVSTGGAWQAVDAPRRHFQNKRFVYKLQAEAYSGAREDSDTVKRFLEDCLPTIHEHLSPCY